MHIRARLFTITALILALAGCGGKDVVLPVDVENEAFEDLRSEIRVAIDDPARETEAIASVDNLADELRALRDKISARKMRTKELNANYDTSRADFDVFFEQVNSEIRSNQQRVTKNHRALLAITTPEEWSQISKARSKAMSAAIKSIQTI